MAKRYLTDDPFKTLYQRLRDLDRRINFAAHGQVDDLSAHRAEVEDRIIRAPAQDLDGVAGRLKLVRFEMLRFYDARADHFAVRVLDNAAAGLTQKSGDR